MSVLGVCDSCKQDDNVMLYPQSKKWLCDECWQEYEQFDRDQDNEREECNICGSPYHSTIGCEYDEFEA